MRPAQLPTGLILMTLLAVGLVVLLPDCASACTCAWNPGISEQERAERALDRSSAVFAGQAVNIKGSLVPEEPGAKTYARVDTVSFQVSEVWKGPERETLEVTTPSEGPACGYPFKEGQEYLVYAYTGKQGLEVDSCGGTQRLTEAQADLTMLGNSEKPTGGEALPDTSGGVAGLSRVLGLAAVAAAAALLLLRRLVP